MQSKRIHGTIHNVIFFKIGIFPCTIKFLHSSCLTLTQSWFRKVQSTHWGINPMGVFCRRHFKSILPNLNIYIFIQILMKFVLILMVQVSNRPETIPLTNDDQVSRSHIAALGHNDLTNRSYNPSISAIVIPLLSQVICDLYCSRNPRPQTIHHKLCRFSVCAWVWLLHDNIIKWKHFSRYWSFVRGIHRSPVDSPHKSQWRGAWMVL